MRFNTLAEAIQHIKTNSITNWSLIPDSSTPVDHKGNPIKNTSYSGKSVFWQNQGQYTLNIAQ